jgi:hypothetical protein
MLRFPEFMMNDPEICLGEKIFCFCFFFIVHDDLNDAQVTSLPTFILLGGVV